MIFLIGGRGLVGSAIARALDAAGRACVIHPAQVGRALAEEDPEPRRRRREIAERESWQSRAEQIRGMLNPE